MIVADVARLMHQRIGLDTQTVGAPLLERAVKQRMAARKLDDPGAYWSELTRSQPEFQELVNLITIPETWFFRDREAFGAMTRQAQSRRWPDAPIRILSLPCSSGEEAYSIVMAMFDAGFGRAEFTVDGVDISSRKIPEAVRGLYGRNSFRGADIGFRERHFEAVDGGWRPKPGVLAQARFRVGNLFDPGGVGGLTGPYDVIFCRNLLIYFDRETQAVALERLSQIMTPEGLLLVGPAESSLPTLHGFASARIPMAFAFLKQDAQPAPAPRLRASAPVPRRAAPTAAKSPAAKAITTPAARPPVAAPTPQELETQSFAAIETSANAGRLDETKAAARRHMDKFGPSPDVFYLLGLAYDADRAPQAAIEHYRKALYLAPEHRETLAHLSLLLAKQGDAAGAKVLSERLGRLASRSDAR